MTLPKITQLEFPESDLVQQSSPSSAKITFSWDFEKGDFVLKDGKVVKIKDVEAIKIWIEKLIRTEKFKFKIYERSDLNDEYGVTIWNLIVGYSNLPQSFIDTEFKREIGYAVLKNPLIESLDSWTIERKGSTLIISFHVNLSNGSSFNQELKFYG